MIEVVHDAETIAKLQKTKGVTATFAKNCIWDWLKEYHSTDERCVLQCYTEFRNPEKNYEERAR